MINGIRSISHLIRFQKHWYQFWHLTDCMHNKYLCKGFCFFFTFASISVENMQNGEKNYIYGQCEQKWFPKSFPRFAPTVKISVSRKKKSDAEHFLLRTVEFQHVFNVPLQFPTPLKILCFFFSKGLQSFSHRCRSLKKSSYSGQKFDSD